MKVLWLNISVLSVCCFALFRAQSLSSDQLRGNQESKAHDITRSLYSTLRNIAFPQNKLNDKPGVESRFLLLTPGQVLNYFDFFPGEEYVRFLQEYQGKNKEAAVPPHVMEKWFDIADGIPSPDIMNGQITGKSLSTIYSTILYGIKIKGFEAKAESQLARYKQARNFLLEPVPDPERLSFIYNYTTRLGLYERYRDEYNDKKLSMEDEIEKVRRNFGSEDYELWFQRHYPSLNSKVESAYTKWMVFGQKELVEFYIAFMDRGSPEKLVEDARAALRASGVISLDRTRTIYPVSFEPSDWYQYILPEPQTFSRDQLLEILGKVKSKLNVITSMVDVINGLDKNSPIVIAAHNLNIALNKSRNNAKSQLKEHLNKQYQCMANSHPDTCSEFHSSEESTLEALGNETKIFALSGANVYTSKSEYLRHLQSEKVQLEKQERDLDATLRVTSPYLGGLLNADQLFVANLTAANRADNWLEFSYDSSSHSEQTDEEQTQKSVATHFGGGVLFFSFHSSFSKSKSTSDLNHHVADSQIKVKGKLLRVHIKRPWFKPSVFDNPDLSFHEGGNGGITTYVAPGTELTETQFVRAVTNDRTRYLLPEYTTGFLLAREIEIEFKGLDSSVVKHAMQSSLHSSTSGGFLFFHFGSSVSKSKHKSHTAISRTADGMSIKIPGAQIIGYYTQKLPQFPAQ